MTAFSKYYIDFITAVGKNIADWFKTFFSLFSKFFWEYPAGYFKAISESCVNNPEFKILDWVAFVVVTIIDLAFVLLLVILVYQLLRKYIRFRKREVEKEELIEEVAILNQRVIELIEEKNKILALRISQLGGGTATLIPGAGSGEHIPGVTRTKEKKKSNAGLSRFTKLIQVDQRYEENPSITTMTPDDMLDLRGLVDRFIQYSASHLRLYYTRDIISRFIAGMATSKVLILEGISGTGKTSLPYAVGKFFQRDADVISVQPSWRDRAELLGYLNEFTKKFNETDFLRAVYEAGYSDKPCVIVLDEMNLARIEYYFAEFLSIMEMPDPNEWKVDLIPGADANDPKNIINGKLLINQNTWFVGTANKDDSTFTITDKVYDRATPIVINQKAEFVDADFTPNVSMTFSYLDELFKKAQSEIHISPKVMEQFAKVDVFIQQKFKIAFGNRIMKQIRLFVPVYVACGFTELDGLDYMLSEKIIRKFESLNIGFLHQELDQLADLLNKSFGKGAFHECLKHIEDLKKRI